MTSGFGLNNIQGQGVNLRTQVNTENNTGYVKLPEAKPDTFTSSRHNQTVDLEKLPSLFVSVENDYMERTGKPISDSSEQVGSYDFPRNHLQPYDILESKYRTHKEIEFMQKVQDLARENKAKNKKIGPEDLYKLALEVNNGDRFKAITTVHDALKMTGRAKQVGTAYSGEDIYIKDLVGKEFFDDYVAKHGGTYTPDMANAMGEAFMAENFAPIGIKNDYCGKYYHLFGTAAGSMTGTLSTVATYVHAAQKNFAGNLKMTHDRLKQNYWEGVPIMEGFSKYVVVPVVSMIAGGHFYGEYTTVGKDKWDADKAGISIGRKLSSN